MFKKIKYWWFYRQHEYPHPNQIMDDVFILELAGKLTKQDRVLRNGRKWPFPTHNTERVAKLYVNHGIEKCAESMNVPRERIRQILCKINRRANTERLK